MESHSYIIDFYNQYDEDSRLSVKHGTVEFLTTVRLHSEVFAAWAIGCWKLVREQVVIPMR